MAANATMMAAIAAASKEESRRKRKASAAGLEQKQEFFASGEDVQYWSESKGRWVEAVVTGTKSRDDGSTFYELDVKGSAPLDKVRRRPKASKVEGFQSFERLDQGHLEAERAKLARARAKAQEAEAPGREAKPITKQVEWSNPPAELRSLEDFEGGRDRAGFIEHFVRFVLGAWRHERDSGFASLDDDQRKQFQNALVQTEEDVAPLILRLRSGETLEKGETREDRKGQRCARTSQDGFSIAEASVLGQLARMASQASKRLYMDGHEAYMQLTLGNKTWHNTCVVHVSASQMQGAREYRRNRDDLNTYDVDPVAVKYIHAMRKIMQFAQCIRPSPDGSQNVKV